MDANLDDTHDPALRSWVGAANEPACEFPIQNLPLGRYRRSGGADVRLGCVIGDQVLDLNAAGLVGHIDMNRLMGAGPVVRRALRHALSQGLREGSDRRDEWQPHLAPLRDVVPKLPCEIGDYTDFYTSIHHATTVGKQFRPDNPLLPNYKWVPIGYHGRASSICASPHPFHRPRGQTKAPDADVPSVEPSRRMDFELELGAYVALPNQPGEPVTMQHAEAHLFGLTLFNDWTARDIQPWEYQPLGPFLSKNFASTVSPWIVTMEALAPFRTPFRRPAGDPDPLPYLDSPFNRASGAIDIALEVWLQTAAMRDAGHPGDRISSANYADAYWTVAQLVAHHTVNGCNLRSGDLLGTGTLSGPTPEQAGSMLELTQGGRQPLTLSSGEQRAFLEDGDTVILRARCEREGRRTIGFGECRGTVLPAR